MKKLKLAVLISGSGSNLQALMDACKAPDYPAEVVAVISNKASAFGLERARNAGIPAIHVDHKAYPDRESFDKAVHQEILKHGAELVCLAGFMRLITPWFIEQWPNKMVNIHPSLLPSFKGLHAQEQAWNAGVKWAGCTIHFVIPEMDAGPIIAQSVVPVENDDTVESLTSRIFKTEHQLYPHAVRLIAEGRVTVVDGRVNIAR